MKLPSLTGIKFFLLLIFSDWCYSDKITENSIRFLKIFERCTFHMFLNRESFILINSNPVIMENIGSLRSGFNITPTLDNVNLYFTAGQDSHDPLKEKMYKNVRTKAHTRYENCFVTLIDVSWIPRRVNYFKHSILKTIIEGLIFLKTNPEYIILQDLISSQPDLSPFLTSSLPFLTFPAKCFAILANFDNGTCYEMRIFAICATCKTSKNMMVPIEKIMSKSAIEKLWYKLHKNLNRLPVRINNINLEMPRITCGSPETGLGMSEAFCVTTTLRVHYNFTLGKISPYGIVYNMYIMNSQAIEVSQQHNMQ